MSFDKIIQKRIDVSCACVLMEVTEKIINQASSIQDELKNSKPNSVADERNSYKTAGYLDALLDVSNMLSDKIEAILKNHEEEA